MDIDKQYCYFVIVSVSINWRCPQAAVAVFNTYKYAEHKESQDIYFAEYRVITARGLCTFQVHFILFCRTSTYTAKVCIFKKNENKNSNKNKNNNNNKSNNNKKKSNNSNKKKNTGGKKVFEYLYY